MCNSDTGFQTISYLFLQQDHVLCRFDLVFDTETFQLLNEIHEPLPPWTRLNYFQCSCCPLDSSEYPYCPLAAQLHPLIDFAADLVSFEELNVRVHTAQRVYHLNTTVQYGISALMGIIIPTAGCPHTAWLRPMARFHLPHSSREETMYRVVSLYLTARFFAEQDDQTHYDGLANLARLYERLHGINQCVARRLRNACSKDSSLNALVILDAFTMFLAMDQENRFGDIRKSVHPMMDMIRQVEGKPQTRSALREERERKSSRRGAEPQKKEAQEETSRKDKRTQSQQRGNRRISN